MSELKDRFSGVAEGYSRFRPTYPAELYSFLLSLAKNTRRAWDVGTGNGQVAYTLSRSFDEVIATDISTRQLEHAMRASNITYRIGRAEASGIEDASIDLTTTAQAAHWFDLPAFGAEVARVSTQGAILALWGYTLLSCDREIDTLIWRLYADILDGLWDLNRELVNRKYRDIHFPFEEIPCPDFEIRNSYTAGDILGYLRTWSAVSKYKAFHGRDPVSLIEDDLVNAFDGRSLQCRTPVFMRAWRIR